MKKYFYLDAAGAIATNILAVAFPLLTIPWIVGGCGVEQYGILALSQAITAVAAIFVEGGSNAASNVRYASLVQPVLIRVVIVSHTSFKLVNFLFTLPVLIGVAYLTSNFILISLLPILLAEVFQPYALCARLGFSHIVAMSTFGGRLLSLILVYFSTVRGDGIQILAFELALGLLVANLIAYMYGVFSIGVWGGQWGGKRAVIRYISFWKRIKWFGVSRGLGAIKERMAILFSAVIFDTVAVAILDVVLKIVNAINSPLFIVSNHFLLWANRINDEVFFKWLSFWLILASCSTAVVLSFLSAELLGYFGIDLLAEYEPFSFIYFSVIPTFISAVVGNYYLLKNGLVRRFVESGVVGFFVYMTFLLVSFLLGGAGSVMFFVIAFFAGQISEGVYRLFFGWKYVAR